jgi:hypothetical protein
MPLGASRHFFVSSSKMSVNAVGCLTDLFHVLYGKSLTHLHNFPIVLVRQDGNFVNFTEFRADFRALRRAQFPTTSV